MEARLMPGLFLCAGPPIHLNVNFVDGGYLKQMRYELTPAQAADLGTILLRLSGATEAREVDQAKQRTDAEFLQAARIATS